MKQSISNPKAYITLATGSSYFDSPDAAIDAAIAALKAGKTYYGPAEGLEALRQAVANRYDSEQGITILPEQVLITPGSKQALFNLFTVLLRAGDEVVIPAPAWFGFQELLKYSKGKSVTLQTHLAEGYAITPDALCRTLNERSRILILTNPGNPTGRVYRKAELEALLEVVNEFPDLYVISDEIYDFVTYGQPVTSIFSCERAPAERTFVVNGFSKSFAMSGWRLGYLAGPQELIKQCIDFQSATLAGVSVFLQDAALATLQNRDKALLPMLDVLQAHRGLMRQGLDAIPEVRYYLPDGAYYFFLDFSYYIGRTTPDGETISTSMDLFRYLREQYNLELAPGDNFGAPGYARMSFAVEKSVLQQALQRLKEALARLR
ncbi:aminotransferase class I/II-fold pyridoxal phosphate-dependent enzyme [Pontibacter sp. 172403-2]|uniref:pyridoxal phosphate-dependent aminotransferase n=1 Tax=Pontibacter rufus TaxID=2791028 RepID=UPI0018B0039B|nr:aminotransferase class I/II-fold pyridoxal phosphate-dependent enzyme [Pontibacter sp. 172403-2]MBF9254272.1 aminotransferase class I/II-fold pyridoxal phosphate-dependent enzyme [Pontibacter sp. 172403-2]